MAASFAAYASQYLNRQQQPGGASLTSSHPMFFSFGSTEDGSQGHLGGDTDLDDLDDPHLRDSHASTATHGDAASSRTFQPGPAGQNEDDDDPYLRLDEDERTGTHGFESRSHHQSAPLITADDNDSVSSGSPKGWLAHLVASPLLHRARSPSPSPSSSSDSSPPPDLFLASPTSHNHNRLPPNQPPPTTRATRQEPHSLSLTESLLPRDGRSRPLDVFSLPDPRHLQRGRRKYNDAIWTSIWLTGVSICVLFSVIVLFAVQQPEKRIPRTILPYFTLLHTVPLLTILTFVTAAVAYVHIFLLQIFVRPVMIATSVFIPVTLFISALCAFIGSFMWDSNTEPTWGETVGLRLFSLIPLLLGFYTGRRLLELPRQIHTTSSTLTLTTHLLIANPFLLALSPAILLSALLASLPFLTLIFRLLLIGYATGPSESSRLEWHVYAWANWAIVGTVAVWLWTWGVARGILRTTAAGVIGAWYFADQSLPPPPPTSTHTIHSALFRATGPSLGTVALSALILTIIRMLTLLTIFLQRLPTWLPVRMVGIIMPAIRFIVGYLDGVTTALSKYALVYTGLTGDKFMSSAKRSRALTSAVESAFRTVDRRRGFGKEPPLTLLTISPLTLTFPFALITYLFVAHTLGAPNQALGAAILAGGVTALVGLFCVGLVKDTADTLYICYCIDKDVGERRRDEVFIIFEPDSTTARGGRRNEGPSQQATAARQSNNNARNNVPRPTRNGSGQPISPPTQPLARPPFQHQRMSSQGSSKAPLSPFKSSTMTQPLAMRTTPLAPPPRIPEDDDPDPFKQSFVEDDGDDEPLSGLATQPLHLKRESGSGSGLGLGRSPKSVVGFNPGPARRSTDKDRDLAMSISPPARVKTSAELNMKSHVFDSARSMTSSSGSRRSLDPYDVGIEQGARSSVLQSQSQSRVKDGKGPEESDLFPGSGFFD